MFFEYKFSRVLFKSNVRGEHISFKELNTSDCLWDTPTMFARMRDIGFRKSGNTDPILIFVDK